MRACAYLRPLLYLLPGPRTSAVPDYPRPDAPWGLVAVFMCVRLCVCRKALNIFVEVGDSGRQARTLLNMCLSHIALGNLTAADDLVRDMHWGRCVWRTLLRAGLVYAAMLPFLALCAR